MIYKSMIFNNDTINIFTDASILTLDTGEIVGCPGYAVYLGDIMIDQGHTIDRNSTNNYSEFHAIFMGVQQALKYQNFKYIRLFSDSQTCILALRERIFNWIGKAKGGLLYGKSNQVIKNQNILMEIIYYIIENNIRIEFFHQKGHVNINKSDDLTRALYVFKDSNNINAYLDLEVISLLSQANDYVDRYTKLMLEKNLVLEDKYNTISFFYNNFNIEKYKELIKGK